MSKIKKPKKIIENSVKSKKDTKSKKADAKNSKAETLKINPNVAKALNAINKKFGENSAIVASKMKGFNERGIERIPTGSVELDVKLGGGIPIGRITHISGAFSSTKTTQSIHIIRNAQKMGILCALMDFENTSTPDYLEALGIDIDNLIYVNPESLEECTDIMIELQQNGVGLIVWDSVAVSEAVKVLNSKMDESVQMGTKQKLIGEYLGKFQSLNNGLSRRGERPCTLIMINQLREKIGTYGDPEYEPGGRAIGFYTSVHIRIRRGDWITEGKGDNKRVVGQEVKFKVLKNKTYKRMQSGDFDFYQEDDNSANVPMYFNDNFKSTVLLALEYDLIFQSGAWFTINADTENEVKFQGIDKVILYLRDNPEIVEDFKEKMLELDAKAN